MFILSAGFLYADKRWIMPIMLMLRNFIVLKSGQRPKGPPPINAEAAGICVRQGIQQAINPQKIEERHSTLQRYWAGSLDTQNAMSAYAARSLNQTQLPSASPKHPPTPGIYSISYCSPMWAYLHMPASLRSGLISNWVTIGWQTQGPLSKASHCRSPACHNSRP